MLDVLAQADSSGVGADRHTELRGEQQDGEVLVHSADTTAIDLADVDCAGLHELLEHNAVVAVLAGSDADGGDLAANAGVAEDVVRAGGLFHPPRVHFGEGAGALDGFKHTPLLVGIDHQLAGRANLLANDAGAAEIVFGQAADLELEVRPALGERLAAEPPNLFLGVAEPSNRRGVRGIAVGFEQREPLRKAGGAAAVENLPGFFAGQGVVDVAEVHRREDMLGRPSLPADATAACLPPSHKDPRRR